MGKIYVFYHIFCSPHTLARVKDQCTKLLFSGLYSRVDAIYCCFAGDETYFSQIESFLKSYGKKFQIHVKKANDTSFERLTLYAMREILKPEDKCLYFHTKGVTKPHLEQIYYWNTYMEYFLMRHHERCIQDLDTYDVVGVKWSTQVGPHFSGNFWWTRGSYFLSLPDTIGPAYLDPEMYIGLKNPKVRNYHSHGGMSLYENLYPPVHYIESTL